MKITIQIKGVLADTVARTVFEKSFVDSITLEELERRLQLPQKVQSIGIVNGKKGAPNTVLQDGDTVVFVPIVGGG